MINTKILQERAKNFSSGPAQLPLDILLEAQKELCNYKESGMSIMEMSHRHSLYTEIHNEALLNIRKLLNVPGDYEVLLIPGGARLQFAMLPLNLNRDGKIGGYIITDVWSEEALNEAKAINGGYVVAGEYGDYRFIPSQDSFTINDKTSYIHITSNNTIAGTQYNKYPTLNNLPLIADMTSDILSREINVSNFDVIYAAAQKNMGPSGVTLVIIKKEHLYERPKNIPPALSYKSHSEENCMLSTPPTFNIYMLNLMMRWTEKQGGVKVIEKLNKQKANLIYETIDGSNGFYRGLATEKDRSHMNVTFRLPSKELDTLFVEEASKENIVGINGHYLVGGCRISIYNGVTLKDCKVLVSFMKHFQKKMDKFVF